jgi:hypothetical protein
MVRVNNAWIFIRDNQEESRRNVGESHLAMAHPAKSFTTKE